MKRKIRMGLVGGGPGSFIGAVHRIAARLDGQIELVCGAFTRDPVKCKAMAQELYLPEERCYASYKEMIECESKLPAGERMDFVSICTPNHIHAEIALYAMDHGFDVLCEKPMTLTVEEAEALAAKVKETGLVFALMHNYTAYPMVRVAKEMIANGDLGEIRRIMAEYPQGWLADVVTEENKQGSWRTDPATTGISCCMGDIGSHAENLSEFITGLQISELCSNIKNFVPGRSGLDDDGDVLLRFENGAVGSILTSFDVWASTLPRIEVYGTRGAMIVPDPNGFDGPVLVKQSFDADFKPWPVMTENSVNSRGIGLSDMADRILNGRDSHRASGDIALHVLEIMEAIHVSSDRRCQVKLESTCTRPEPMKL